MIEINHSSKRVVVYEDKSSYSKYKLKKYNELPISIELEKPYVYADVVVNNKKEKVKLLLDTGGSDAIWLFENTGNLKCPPLYFDDFLGKGFSGDIFGKRSRIDEMILANSKIEFPTVSFPSESSIKSVNLVEGRNGSIGSGIIKRFNVIFDYENFKMYLRKNKDFHEPFNYNMSGIEVQHNGKEIIQEEVIFANLTERDNKGGINVSLDNTPIRYKFSLKPVYEVSNVRENSPAFIAGLNKGDILIKINGEQVYKYKLSEITELFQSEEGKWISIEYTRKGKKLKTKFQLKKIL